MNFLSSLINFTGTNYAEQYQFILNAREEAGEYVDSFNEPKNTICLQELHAADGLSLNEIRCRTVILAIATAYIALTILGLPGSSSCLTIAGGLSVLWCLVKFFAYDTSLGAEKAIRSVSEEAIKSLSEAIKSKKN